MNINKEKKIHFYNLNSNTISAIDLSPVQENYSPIYGSGAIPAQLNFFKEVGLENFYDKRVIVQSAFGTRVLKNASYSDSGFHGDELVSKCCKYDAVITSTPGLPIFVPWSDCPWVLFATQSKVGVVHASRKTLDNGILYKFLSEFVIGENVKDIKLALSPYIFPDNFDHDFLSLKREADWNKCNGIIKSANGYQLDLEKMILFDLYKFGIKLEQVDPIRIDSYSVSMMSYENGGVAISHRHANNNMLQEGRGALCLMLIS